MRASWLRRVGRQVVVCAIAIALVTTSTPPLSAQSRAPSPSQTPSPRLQQYLALAQSSLERPITPEELRRAVSSPSGVASIRALFERAISESVLVASGLVVPELGGEAMLDDGRATFVVYPDPLHPLVREMVNLSERPSELLDLLSTTPDGQALLKNTGGLHALLWQLSRPESQSPATEGGAHVNARELLESIIDGAVSQHFRTWTVDPATQAVGIESTDWRGRYLGFWHIHPPRLLRGVPAVAGGQQRRGALAFGEGIEPSHQDMTNAVELGQFVTIVFQPNGFDVYDLSALGRTGRVELARAVVTHHRDTTWEQHFLSAVRSVVRQ